ncbi:domain-containing protein [Lichtheimia corymbifera JMRC:FSU:9682]|uniref:Domain-containing protein n=1 Tax=Lichtheimia corymbifera JMRC:FSU:9682 TaxID=1263082 RepID=A0A068RHX2_9FUNG|nr:domain-containing protein [Lichtheimia corymbifera JMRC:FSU:9682]
MTAQQHERHRPDRLGVIRTLKRIVQSHDTLQCCIPVELPSIAHNDATDEYYIAVIRHYNEACILLFKGQPGSIPPIVLYIIPVYESFHYTIAQAAANVKGACPAFRVSLNAQHGCNPVSDVLFPAKEDMMTFLSNIKPVIDLARKNKLAASGTSHHWTNVYSQYCLEEDDHRSMTTTADTKTISSTLPHVLPWLDSDPGPYRSYLSRTTRSPNQMLTGDAAKRHWLNTRLIARQDEFVTWDTLRIFAGTYNVHGRLPTMTLKPWLAANANFDPDFYVIGLQEMESGKDAYVRYDPAKENAWVKAIFKALGDKSEEYYKVATQQLVTILIVVIAKKKHQRFITDVDTAYVGVGLMNMMGNKGGVGIRFRFHDSYLCFVGCHLAAFTDQVDRRNQDFIEICKRLTFTQQPDPLIDYVKYSWSDADDEGMALLDDQGVARDWSLEGSVFHCDHLIWLGDLNYRINFSEPEIKSCLRKGQLDTLIVADQLTIERKDGRAFSMFEEGKLNFQPTYKYDAGTNMYDSSAKRRAPAWTDRILWRKDRIQPSTRNDVTQQPTIKLIRYDSCMDMLLSDHKPVYAHMEIKVRKIHSSNYERCEKALKQQISASNGRSNNAGQCQLSTAFVQFDDVHFMESKEMTLELENTGDTLTSLGFVPKVDDGEEQEQVCPPWLQIHPTSGVLAPGEKTMLYLRIRVDPAVSAPLNEGNQQIDTVLVLRLENGKDLYIVVKGRYIPTCLGIHLDRLALMSLPVSSMSSHPNPSSKKNGQAITTADNTSTQQATLPKELWRVLNYLWNKSMLSIDTLFLQHGDPAICDYIRRCLDTGNALDTTILLNKSDPSSSADEIAANSMVDVLVAFLECLPEPVIPSALYELALEASDSSQAMAELKDRLPYIHLNVLLYIASFLKDAIQLAPDTVRQERTCHIVQMFTIVLRPPPLYKQQNPQLAKQKASQFILQLLQ